MKLIEAHVRKARLHDWSVDELLGVIDLAQETLRHQCAKLEKELHQLRHYHLTLQQDVDTSRETVGKATR
jgi:hypothetical protein